MPAPPPFEDIVPPPPAFDPTILPASAIAFQRSILSPQDFARAQAQVVAKTPDRVMKFGRRKGRWVINGETWDSFTIAVAVRLTRRACPKQSVFVGCVVDYSTSPSNMSSDTV